MSRALLLLLLLLAACSDSGTRHSKPNARVGQFSLYWWPQANSLYLLETVDAHLTLLGQTLNGHTEPVSETNIIFYRTSLGLLTAHRSTQSAYGTVLILGLQLLQGSGFIHPWTNAIHIYAGQRLEADQLGHLMLHRTINDPNHQDARWARFLIDDWLLSLSIYSRR